VAKNCGEVVESRGFEVFLLPLPAKRGAKYIKQCYMDEVGVKLARFLEEHASPS
jgi:hypothetical protein